MQNLPGKALRKLVGLTIFYLYTLYIDKHIKTYNNIQDTNGTCVLKAEPFNHDIKRHEPAILFISLSIGSLIKIALMT